MQALSKTVLDGTIQYRDIQPRILTDEKYGKTSYQKQGNDYYRCGEENFKVELVRNNMSKRDIVPCVNLFSKVYVEEDGSSIMMRIIAKKELP